MLVDCDTCAVRGDACSGCVVTVLIGTPPSVVEFDDEERRALRVLARAGLVPELLHLVPLVTDAPLTDGPPATGVPVATDPDDLPCGYLPVDLPPTPVHAPLTQRRRARPSRARRPAA
jgi:hypothetical protein